ncbi:MAG: HD domain-containing phosphohydrolase [Ectothiorhodospiraceae bacterium]
MSPGKEQQSEARAVSPEAHQDFFPLPLGVMQPGTSAPVDLYLHEENPPRFVLYKSADAPLTDQVRQRLIRNGVEELHMRGDDEEAYHRYVEEQLDTILQDDLLTAEKALPIVYQSASRVVHHLFDDPRSGENLKRASRMVGFVVESVLESADPLQDISSLITHDYYTYTHSVNVCGLLVAAAKDLLAISSAKTLREIGRGAILHDIGKSQIPREILEKPGQLTPDEFEQIKEHPVVGLEMAGEHMRLSPTAAAIIRNHHEHYDGSGYPDGLAGEDIPPIVRFSTVVDVYDALTTKRSYGEAAAPFAALQIMTDEMEGHFGLEELRSFIRYLGPKERMHDVRSRRPPAPSAAPAPPIWSLQRRAPGARAAPAADGEGGPGQGAASPAGRLPVVRRTQQLSVVLTSGQGQLASLSRRLADADIGVLALSVLDSTETTTVRLVADKPDQAAEKLREHGLAFASTEVLVFEVAGARDALARVSGRLADEGVEVNFIYGSRDRAADATQLVLSCSDLHAAERIVAGA